MSNKYWKRALIFLVWLAFGLRLFRLGAQSLWYDEAVSWYLSQFTWGDLMAWTAADIQPPFYYLLIWVSVRLFGTSEFALRFPSVIFGVLTIPLMAQLARRIFPVANSIKTKSLFQPAILAASLTALAPIIIYYSQEARMYTLLVFQACLSSWLLLDLRFTTLRRRSGQIYDLPLALGAQGGKEAKVQRRKVSEMSIHRFAHLPIRLFAYSLVMASALYTHYFSAFLMVVHSLYFLASIVLSQPTTNKQTHSPLRSFTYSLISPVLMFGGTLLLFAPWLQILLARLGDDPSYWPGQAKLGEVMLDVLLSFAVGGKREMILEATGLPLTFGFGLLLLFSLGLVVYRDRQVSFIKGWGPTLFLVGWLVIPLIFILGLTYQTPKFNPRYTILAWPAVGLLLGGGLACLWGFQRQRYRLLALLACLYIVGSWGLSLRNWYFVPQFAKDDFKHVAQFVRERFTPGDTVLLSSGHLFPVWLYYNQYNQETTLKTDCLTPTDPDFTDYPASLRQLGYCAPPNWLPLPNLERLDVNEVASFDLMPTLESHLRGQQGVWLVQWQTEVIDPNGVVPLILNAVGQPLADEFHRGDFWGVELDYWQLTPPLSFPADYPATIRNEANFGNLVALHGLRPQAPPETGVTLFWEALQPLTKDYLVALRLVDEVGVSWSEMTRVARPAAYLYPTPRWQPGQIIPGTQPLPWLPGTPPGDYWVEVGWLTADGNGVDVLDANGNPQRRTVLGGPITLYEPIPGLQAVERPRLHLGHLALQSVTFEPSNPEAGSRVLIDMVWQVATTPPLAATLTLSGWRDAEGQIYPLAAPVAVKADYPPGTIFRLRAKVMTPFQAGGEITLQGYLHQLAGQSASPVANPLDLATLTVQDTDRNFAPPSALDITFDTVPQFALTAQSPPLMTLLGATLTPQTLQPDQAAELTLYWRGEATSQTDYTIFVHLLGPDGLPVLSADHAPPRPTSNWIEGEIIADPITLTIPLDLPPGHYPLEVGVYNASDPNFTRLSLVNRSNNYIILAELEIN